MAPASILRLAKSSDRLLDGLGAILADARDIVIGKSNDTSSPVPHQGPLPEGSTALYTAALDDLGLNEKDKNRVSAAATSRLTSHGYHPEARNYGALRCLLAHEHGSDGRCVVCYGGGVGTSAIFLRCYGSNMEGMRRLVAVAKSAALAPVKPICPSCETHDKEEEGDEEEEEASGVGGVGSFLLITLLVGGGAAMLEARRLLNALRAHGVEPLKPEANARPGALIEDDGMSEVLDVFTKVFGESLGKRLLTLALSKGWRYQHVSTSGDATPTYGVSSVGGILDDAKVALDLCSFCRKVGSTVGGVGGVEGTEEASFEAILHSDGSPKDATGGMVTAVLFTATATLAATLATLGFITRAAVTKVASFIDAVRAAGYDLVPPDVEMSSKATPADINAPDTLASLQSHKVNLKLLKRLIARGVRLVKIKTDTDVKTDADEGLDVAGYRSRASDFKADDDADPKEHKDDGLGEDGASGDGVGATVTYDPSSDLIVDCRTRAEYDKRHLSGAVNIPIDDMEAGDVQTLAAGRRVVVFCTGGMRAARAVHMLRSAGLDACSGHKDDACGCPETSASNGSATTFLTKPHRSPLGVDSLLGTPSNPIDPEYDPAAVATFLKTNGSSGSLDDIEQWVRDQATRGFYVSMAGQVIPTGFREATGPELVKWGTKKFQMRGGARTFVDKADSRFAKTRVSGETSVEDKVQELVAGWEGISCHARTTRLDGATTALLRKYYDRFLLWWGAWKKSHGLAGVMAPLSPSPLSSYVINSLIYDYNDAIDALNGANPEQRTRITGIQARINAHRIAVDEGQSKFGSEPEMAEYVTRWEAFRRQVNKLAEEADSVLPWSVTDNDLRNADNDLTNLITEWANVSPRIELRKEKALTAKVEKVSRQAKAGTVEPMKEGEKAPTAEEMRKEVARTREGARVDLQESAATKPPPPAPPPPPSKGLSTGTLIGAGAALAAAALTAIKLILR